jgi:23S rRNA (adenine2503-C2)-methyltransferase
LIVSLTSAVEEKRRTLLPVAGRFSMSDLVRVLRSHQASLGKRITLAWVLMNGVNHGDDELEALTRELGELPIRINLIDVNDATGQYGVVSDDERIAFVGKLHAAGIATQRRYSGGKNEHAACGMLSAKHRGAQPLEEIPS